MKLALRNIEGSSVGNVSNLLCASVITEKSRVFVFQASLRSITVAASMMSIRELISAVIYYYSVYSDIIYGGNISLLIYPYLSYE